MTLSWIWRAFLMLGVLWNVMGGLRMMLDQERFLGAAASSGPPNLFLLLLGYLLLILAGVTALILARPGRFWPLLWLAAVGRTGAGGMMLTYWSQEWAPESIVIPGAVDLAFGVGSGVLAVLCARQVRAVGD